AMTSMPIAGDRSLVADQDPLRVNPVSFLGRWAQIAALNLLGRYEECAKVGESTLRMSGRAPWIIGALARTYARLGRRADAEALYMELQWRARREYVAPAVLGWAAWAAGEHDEAIRLEEKAHAIGDPSLIAAKYWPDFTQMHEDARFQEILKARGWT